MKQILPRSDRQRACSAALVKEARLWRGNGWTARVIKNEDDPYALLRAHDANDEVLAQVRVGPGFKLSRASASAWIEDGFRKPG
jgi:hypothetical protein